MFTMIKFRCLNCLTTLVVFVFDLLLAEFVICTCHKCNIIEKYDYIMWKKKKNAINMLKTSYACRSMSIVHNSVFGGSHALDVSFHV